MDLDTIKSNHRPNCILSQKEANKNEPKHRAHRRHHHQRVPQANPHRKYFLSHAETRGRLQQETNNSDTSSVGSEEGESSRLIGKVVYQEAAGGQVGNEARGGQVGKLHGDLARLKVDKLELLRQNVAAQREIKR